MHLTLFTSLLGLFSLTTTTATTFTNPNTELTRVANHGYCGWGYTLPASQGKHVILLGDGEQHSEFLGDEGNLNSVFISLTCTCQLYGDETCNPNKGYYAEKMYGAYDLPSAVSCFQCVDAHPPPVRGAGNWSTDSRVELRKLERHARLGRTKASEVYVFLTTSWVVGNSAPLMSGLRF